MAIQTHAAASSLLKRVYFPGIRDQLNNETPGLGILERVGKERWSGSEVRAASRIGRNRSYRPTGSSNESAALPTAGRQTFDNYVINCVLMHGTGGLTAFGAAATQGSESAFEQMLKAEVDGLIADAKKDREIDFYNLPTGVIGRIGNVGGGAGALVLEQTQALDVTKSMGNRYFSPGMLVDIVDEANNATIHNTGVSVDSVDSANRTTIAVSALAGAAAAGDFIVRSGTLPASAGGAAEAAFAFSGLDYLIDDTTTMPAQANMKGYELDILQGINRGTAANSWAKSSVVDLNGADLTRTHLHNAIYLMEERGATYPDVILTHRSVQLAIADLMVGDQRYTPQEFPGGFKAEALVFNGGDRDVPILVSRECPYDRAYFLDLDAIKMFVLQDFELIETDGSVLRQSGTGDAWQFSYRMFGNMGTLQSNAAAKIVRIGGADDTFGASGRIYDF
tara:strand:- start:20904 stop:22256 length:1353 start_codon:yes stop_codon:yes gene_type:complete